MRPLYVCLRLFSCGRANTIFLLSQYLYTGLADGQIGPSPSARCCMGFTATVDGLIYVFGGATVKGAFALVYFDLIMSA